MSLKVLPIPTILEETARVVRACFPHGTLVVHLRDALGALYRDEDFADLFPPRGQPAEAPWRLALVTVLQFLEGLPNRQAADAVRSRPDWMDALSLELTDPGFCHTVLSEFRTRLVAGQPEQRLLDLVLAQARDRGWLKVRGKQRTGSTQVLAAVRALTRLEAVGETVRHTLNVLTEVAPEWLRARAQPEWLGWSAMRTGSRSIACRAARSSVSSTATQSARMAGGCWPRSMRPPLPPGCVSCRRCRRCAGCGRSSSTHEKRPAKRMGRQPEAREERGKDGGDGGATQRRPAARGAGAELALRARRPLRQEARDELGRLQAACDREL